MSSAPDLDCLLVHAPKAQNHYLPFGDFMNIGYLPMGLPAIAEWLARHGLRTELVHTGVEHIRDPQWRIVDHYEGAQIRSIGVCLYWHYQSFDAIEVARALARSHAEAFVFLGGVTASYFAEEILRTIPEIQGVVRGHGEMPVLELNRVLRDGGDLADVPNLAWRDGDGRIHDNRATSPYFARPADLDALSFGDLSLLRNADIYAATFGFPLAYSLEYTAAENRGRLNMGRPFFPLFTGRGCPWQCTFCGGNRKTLEAINGRGGLVWRSPARVVDDIRRAMTFGYRTMSLCFDPVPHKDDYYVELFRRVREAKLEVDFYFECWGLPPERFVREFRTTFPHRESYVALSPDSGDEEVRRTNKQPYYSNDALHGALRLLQQHDVSADVFYTVALPGETTTEARTTWDQMRELNATYDCTRRIMVWSVQLEPGSAQYERPESLGMVSDRSSFQHFYEAHGGARADTYSSLGYKIEGYFGDERDDGSIADFERHLQHLKCMEMCFLAPDPRDFALPSKGRAECFDRRRSLAQRRGTELPVVRIGAEHGYMDALNEERGLRGERPRLGWV